MKKSELAYILCGVLHTTPDYFPVGTENPVQLDKKISNKAERLSADNRELLDGIIDLMISKQNK